LLGVPKKLLEGDYKFHHPSLDEALAALFARQKKLLPHGLRTFVAVLLRSGLGDRSLGPQKQ
jgi:hypothetical protein